MSKTVSNKKKKKRARSLQKQKNKPTIENEEQANMDQASIATVLTELKTLCAEFGGFGSKLDGINGQLCKMANSIEALENNMNEVKWELASNTARMEEAETWIMSTEEKLETNMAELNKASGRIT